MGKAGIERCICNICKCGRHRCPHHHRKLSAPYSTQKLHERCLLSTYKTAFEGNRGPKRGLMIPNDCFRKSDIPFQSSTEYRNTFHRKSPQFFRPPKKWSWHPPKTKMVEVTSYGSDFADPKGTTIPDKFIPEDQIKPSKRPFHQYSLYQDVYRDIDRSEWEKARLPPVKHEDCLSMGQGEMDSITMNQAAYVEHKDAQTREMIKPKSHLFLEKPECVEESTYCIDFPPRDNVKTEPVKKPSDQWVITPTPMDHKSSVQKDYTWPKQEKMPQHIPEDNIKLSGDMDCKTTVREHFQKWPVNVRVKQTRPPPAQTKPQLVNTTRYQDDFIEHKAARPAKAEFPRDNGDITADVLDRGKMMNNSWYAEKFKEIPNQEMRKPYIPQDCLSTSKDPISDYTAYGDKFKGDAGEPRMIHGPPKPQWSKIGVHGPMNDNTTYGQDYKEKGSMCCPAIKLLENADQDTPGTEMETNDGKYVLTKVQGGHHYFAPDQFFKKMMRPAKRCTSSPRNSKVYCSQFASKSPELPKPPKNSLATDVPCTPKTASRASIEEISLSPSGTPKTPRTPRTPRTPKSRAGSQQNGTPLPETPCPREDSKTPTDRLVVDGERCISENYNSHAKPSGSTPVLNPSGSTPMLPPIKEVSCASPLEVAMENCSCGAAKARRNLLNKRQPICICDKKR